MLDTILVFSKCLHYTSGVLMYYSDTNTNITTFRKNILSNNLHNEMYLILYKNNGHLVAFHYS